MSRAVLVVLFALSSIAILLGCGELQQSQTLQTERTLSAAGFQMRLAETPQRMNQLQALPQHKFIVRQHEGKPFYLWADATDCKCIYAGTERAYQEFQRLAIKQNVEAQQAQIADEAFGFDTWGPWAPWWY